MTRIKVEHLVSPKLAAELLSCRKDLLIEEEVEPGRFVQREGPFRSYSRTIKPAADGDELDEGHLNGGAGALVALSETTEFKLAIPIWRPLVNPLMKRALSQTDRSPRGRNWWPQEIVSTESASLVAIIATVTVMAGYLGVMASQTIAFASKEFGASQGDQANTLAAMRVGVLLSLALTRYADRIGRKPLMLGFAFGSVVFTAFGSLAPSLNLLGGTQAAARGFSTGLATLLVLTVSEEVPAKIRGLALSIMTMCGGLGAGLLTMMLPLADQGDKSWRLLYLIPITFIPVLIWFWRIMPETRRFEIAAAADSSDAVDWRRFAMLGIGAFSASLFLTPASQLGNTFLISERGFSGGEISIFRLLIGTPVGIPILAAGFFADRRGRKPIGAIGIFLGTFATLATFFSRGIALWVVSALSFWMLAAAFTVLRSYQTELFPTRSRARVGGWLDVIGVSGSVIGLLVVGRLADHYGSIGPAISIMVWGPLLTAILVFFFYPETAGKELEELNPSDPAIQSETVANTRASQRGTGS